MSDYSEEDEFDLSENLDDDDDYSDAIDLNVIKKDSIACSNNLRNSKNEQQNPPTPKKNKNKSISRKNGSKKDSSSSTHRQDYIEKKSKDINILKEMENDVTNAPDSNYQEIPSPQIFQEENPASLFPSSIKKQKPDQAFHKNEVQEDFEEDEEDQFYDEDSYDENLDQREETIKMPSTSSRNKTRKNSNSNQNCMSSPPLLKSQKQHQQQRHSNRSHTTPQSATDISSGQPKHLQHRHIYEHHERELSSQSSKKRLFADDDSPISNPSHQHHNANPHHQISSKDSNHYQTHSKVKQTPEIYTNEYNHPYHHDDHGHHQEDPMYSDDIFQNDKPIISKEEKEFRRSTRNIDRETIMMRRQNKQQRNQFVSPKALKTLISENERLRKQLRNLNMALDDHIKRDRQQKRNRARKTTGAVESKQLHNLYKQVENYKKSDEFLRKQVSKLSECQNESYSDMSLQLRNRGEKIKKLKKEIKTLNRKLNRPVTPSRDPDYEIQLIQELNKSKDETKISRRQHQKDLERIRELEKLTRTKHTENCKLKKEVTKLKQEAKFKSPKKLRNTQSKTKKKIQELEDELEIKRVKFKKLESFKNKMQKLTFRQNKEIELFKVEVETKINKIKHLKKIIAKKDSVISRKVKLNKLQETPKQTRDIESHYVKDAFSKQDSARRNRGKLAMPKASLSHDSYASMDDVYTKQRSREEVQANEDDSPKKAQNKSQIIISKKEKDFSLKREKKQTQVNRTLSASSSFIHSIEEIEKGIDMSIENLSNTKLVMNDNMIMITNKNNIHLKKEIDIIEKNNEQQIKNLENPEKIYLYENNIVVLDKDQEEEEEEVRIKKADISPNISEKVDLFQERKNINENKIKHTNSNSKESLKEKPKRFNMNEIFNNGSSNNSSRRSSNRSSFSLKEHSFTSKQLSSKKEGKISIASTYNTESLNISDNNADEEEDFEDVDLGLDDLSSDFEEN